MSFGVTELLIIAVIVLVVFGSSKLRNLGGDLGSAIKGFKNAVSEDEKTPAGTDADANQENPKLMADEPSPPPGDKQTTTSKKESQ